MLELVVGYGLVAVATFVLLRDIVGEESDFSIGGAIGWPFLLVGVVIAGLILTPALLLSALGYLTARLDRQWRRLRRSPSSPVSSPCG